MNKEYAPGSAPEMMEMLATKIRAFDAFVFIPASTGGSQNAEQRHLLGRMLDLVAIADLSLL
jgi:hypothetical protein